MNDHVKEYFVVDNLLLQLPHLELHLLYDVFGFIVFEYEGSIGVRLLLRVMNKLALCMLLEGLETFYLLHNA